MGCGNTETQLNAVNVVQPVTVTQEPKRTDVINQSYRAAKTPINIQTDTVTQVEVRVEPTNGSGFRLPDVRLALSLFAKFDKDRSGKLENDEIPSALAAYIGARPRDAQLEPVVFWLSGDRSLSPAAFSRLVYVALNGGLDDQAKMHFLLADEDCNGVIQGAELRSFLNKIGCSADITQRVCGQVSHDATYAEFHELHRAACDEVKQAEWARAVEMEQQEKLAKAEAKLKADQEEQERRRKEELATKLLEQEERRREQERIQKQRDTEAKIEAERKRVEKDRIEKDHQEQQLMAERQRKLEEARLKKLKEEEEERERIRLQQLREEQEKRTKSLKTMLAEAKCTAEETATVQQALEKFTSENEDPYQAMCEAYVKVVTHHTNQTECDDRIKYTAIGLLLHGQRYKFNYAQLLNIAFQANGIDSQLHTSKHGFVVVMVECEGEKFICDPASETAVEDSCLFKCFMLNKRQSSEMFVDVVEQAMLDSLSEADMDYYSQNQLVGIASQSAADRVMESIRKWECYKNPIPGFKDKLNADLKLIAAQKQLKQYKSIGSSYVADKQIVLWFEQQTEDLCMFNDLDAWLRQHVKVDTKLKISVLATKKSVDDVQDKIIAVVMDMRIQPPNGFSYWTQGEWISIEFESGAAIPIQDEKVKTEGIKYYLDQVTNKRACESILKALKAVQKVAFFSPELKFTVPEYENACDVIRKEYPELWYFVPSTYISFNGYIKQMNLIEDDEKHIAEVNQKLADKKAQILQQFQLKDTATQKLEKIQQVLSLAKYDLHPLEQFHKKHIRTVVGCLLNRVCVCAGYTAAFKFLCDQLGIPSVMISGDDMNLSDDITHVWNLVQVNKQWYHFDATWNRTGGAMLWFCVDEPHILRDHVITEKLRFPKATIMVDNYFEVRHQRITGGAAQADLEALLVKMIDKRETSAQVWFDGTQVGDVHQIATKVMFETKQDFDLQKVSVINGSILNFEVVYKGTVVVGFQKAEDIKPGITFMVKCSPQEFATKAGEMGYPSVSFSSRGEYVEFKVSK